MTNFTPYSALFGGALIGLSAVLLRLFNGRIAGISGIVGGALARRSGETLWRLAFLAGLIAAPLLYRSFGGAMPFAITHAAPLLIVGGLLVGIGTRMGGGCTSGHGVCGLAQMSPRALVATLTFLATAIATVFVARHLVGG
jgi:uncharacterized protein